MDKSTLESAIRGLEHERQRLDNAIRELRAQRDGSTGKVVVNHEEQARPARKKRRLSAAGRRAIAEAARRRWAAKRAAEKPQGGGTKAGRAKRSG